MLCGPRLKVENIISGLSRYRVFIILEKVSKQVDTDECEEIMYTKQNYGFLKVLTHFMKFYYLT